MKKVINNEALTNIFGYWPSFHDAEVTQVRLDRGEGVGPAGETTNPTLEADIHVFEMSAPMAPTCCASTHWQHSPFAASTNWN